MEHSNPQNDVEEGRKEDILSQGGTSDTSKSRDCFSDEGNKVNNLATIQSPECCPTVKTKSLENSDSNNSTQKIELLYDELTARRETLAVLWLRITVLAVLVISTIIVATIVHSYISDSEEDKFEGTFEVDSTRIFEALGWSIDRSLGAIDNFVVGMVSFARYSNATWPFVVVPDFGVRVAKLRTLSKATVVSNYYLVTQENRRKWEAYSLANDGWVKEGLETQKKDKTYHGLKVSDYEPYGIVHTNDGPSEGMGPFFPMWQSSPVVPIYAPYNWDGAGYQRLAEALPNLLKKREAVVSKITNYPESNDPKSIADIQTTIDWVKDYLGKEDDPAEPMSDIFYPIISTAADSVSIVDEGDEEGEVVGILSMTVFWRDLIKDIMVSDSLEVVAVFENSCNQSFTYAIHGPDVEYLGRGDLHDNRYDYLKKSSELKHLSKYSSGDSYSYTGLPLSGDTCPFTLHLYPSTLLENAYTTPNRMVFTVVAVFIFVFTSAVFLVYDRCVEKRQRKVMTTAMMSTMNVSVLEQKVKERTSALQETNRRLEEANRRVKRAAAAQLEHFAMMSHEIRTPLNCIIGLSSLLLDSELDQMQEESMKMIVNSGDLLLTVVNDVLDYSKLESGNVEIDVKPSNLQETLNSVVHSIATKARSKNIALVTHYDVRLGETITTDCRRLQQILYNLLGNAIKFSREGGSVEMDVSLSEVLPLTNMTACKSDNHSSLASNQNDLNLEGSAPLTLNSSRAAIKLDRRQNSDLLYGTEQRVIRFAIKDSGSGINREDFENIFCPFRQASAETEAVYGGTGLGLAITSKLVGALGGSIYVDSQEGEWSTFTVDLPYFDGGVDTESIATGLKDVAVYMVDNNEENIRHASRIFDHYAVHFSSFESMQEMNKVMTSTFLHCTKKSICLVREDLYEQEFYRIWKSQAPCYLLSFGPKYSLKESKGHFRSLTQVLPSMLMQSLIDVLKIESLSGQETPEIPQVALSANKIPCCDLRVLIAEDNKINQKVLSRMLKRLSIEHVDIVDNGQKAVEKESYIQYDLILMDMQMPIMNGIDACKLIMSRQGGHEKPAIIFVTAHAADSYEKECIAAGGSGFLPKPFSIGDIEKVFKGFNRNEVKQPKNLPLVPES